MLTHSQVQKTVTYVSEILPDVETQDLELARTIAWADANPFVWKIVTGTRSKAFGRKSCEYIGWAQRSDAPEAVLERARHFHACVDSNVCRDFYHGSTDISGWRARFTFEHFQDYVYFPPMSTSLLDLDHRPEYPGASSSGPGVS